MLSPLCIASPLVITPAHRRKLPKDLMMDPDRLKYELSESDIPKSWYNIQADLPTPAPAVLHPGTGQPIGPDDLAPIFPMPLILQEVSTEREIEIPKPVRDVYEANVGSPPAVYG